MPAHSPSTHHAPDLASVSAGHGRYMIRRLIGVGRTGQVYEAIDRDQQRVALKRFQAQTQAAQHERNLERFEREYHTLHQLPHPSIVRVHDFDIDEQGTYYTMELLPGSVEALAPLPWQRVCEVARDLCSALSLLHSRRLVHRDISPRNVRRSEDGQAKLIDLAALGPFGTTKRLWGTPPCCAPETLHLQCLDARVDLFGLGATLYYLLCGAHAYPARSFGALPQAWRSGVPRLEDPEIPAELGALVLDLLQLDPDARPASALEVMQRLAAIDAAPAVLQLKAATGYLVTPALVGREAARARVQRRMRRVTGGRPRSVVIEGPAGVGRTRFLDACLLEATVRGQPLVRADADDALSGDYGVVRAIARQLFWQLPEQAFASAAEDRQQLATIIPELRSDALAANDTELARGPLQRALLAWLTRLSKQTPFVLAIDDFHRIDEPSATLIALLERDSLEHALCLLITVESGASWSAPAAHKLLTPLTTLQLDPLSAQDDERLLGSVFGELPQAPQLAHRLRALCHGSARDLLLVAQHLVARGDIRAVQGAWILRAELPELRLPASMSDALGARIAALPNPARELACVLALCPDQRFSYEDCGVLCGLSDPGERLAQIHALLSADVARHSDENVRLSARAWVPLLKGTLSPERAELLEARLAELFELRAGEELRAARHWFRANMPEQALDMLMLHIESTHAQIHRSPEGFQRYASNLPEGWCETFQAAVRYCDVLRRTRRHKLELLSRLVGSMAMLNIHVAESFSELFLELRRDSGYDDWQALDPEMDPKTRLFAALNRAEERFAATPEDERLLDPAEAVRRLARYMIAATGPISLALDVTMLRALPRLHAFAALSPALEASDQLLEGIEARCTGHVPRALACYTALLSIVDGPDHGRMDPAFATYLRLGVISDLGMIEAGLGLRTCARWATELDSHEAYRGNAAVIRMLHCLFQGDRSGAETHRLHAERLRMQNGGLQAYEGGQLIWQLQAYALSGDLSGVRQMREAIKPLTARYPHWQPVSRYAAAEYHRMTRGFERARAELEHVLATVSAGRHPIWPHAAHAHVLTLLELGEHAQALTVAQEYVTCASRALEHVPSALQLAHALCRAHAGDDGAAPSVEDAISRMEHEGITGLHLGVAHETRARVALLLEDEAAFAQHSELCRQHFRAHENAALTAKYRRIVHDGQRSLASVGAPKRATLYPESNESTRIELALADCRDEDQRARLALTLLLRESGARAGLLYLVQAEGPVSVAQLGAAPDPSSLTPQLQRYLAARREHEEQTDAEPESAPQLLCADGHTFIPLLLSHYERDALIVTGIAVLGFAGRGEHAMPADTAATISQFYAHRSRPSIMPPPRDA